MGAEDGHGQADPPLPELAGELDGGIEVRERHEEALLVVRRRVELDEGLGADAGRGRHPVLESVVIGARFFVEPEDVTVAADELHVDEVVRGRAVDVRPGREGPRADEVAADGGGRLGGVDPEAAPEGLLLELERGHARFDRRGPVVEVEGDPAHPGHVEDDPVREDEAEDAAAVAPDGDGQAELAGQADDRRDLVPRSGQDHVARHLRSGQREGVVGVGPEDGRVVRSPVSTDDAPSASAGHRLRQGGRSLPCRAGRPRRSP